MPNAETFKYGDGDTAVWRAKYYALCEYAAQTGASVEEILAWALTQSPSWGPATEPTLLRNLNAGKPATADNIAYTLTHSPAWASMSDQVWFLLDFSGIPNLANPTLQVDALAAWPIYGNGAALGGGELNGLVLVMADTGNSRFNALTGSGVSDFTPGYYHY